MNTGTEGVRVGRIRRAARRFRRRWVADRGAATAEYVITIMAAVALAGVLVAIMKGDDVKAWLSDLVHRALAGG